MLGLVKYRRVIAHDIHRNFVTTRLISTNSANHTFCIPGINFSFHPAPCLWIVNYQFPLRLVYAATFSSCQGLTLDRVVLDLRLYTAVSRVRNCTCTR